MTDPHEGREALRKHREKRRAKAAAAAAGAIVVPTTTVTTTIGEDTTKKALDEKHVSSDAVQTSLNHTADQNQSQQPQILSTVTATASDRERMRKISKLGLEDPVDLIRQQQQHNTRKNIRAQRSSNHNNNSHTPIGMTSDIIIDTDSARERMRKISNLGWEDPADSAYMQDHTATPHTHRSTTPLSRHRNEREYRQPGGKRDRVVVRSKTGLDEVTHTNRPRKFNSSPVRGRMQRAKSADQSGYLFPSVITTDIPLPIPEILVTSSSRTRTLDDDIPLIEDENALAADFSRNGPPTPLEHDLDPLNSDGLDGTPFVQVHIPQFGDSNRSNGPKNFSGVVQPTKEQQQLMRKISALGMYDPVFGNVHKDMIKVNHASMIFDDMDLNDVPQDMRDMVTLASDRTDPAGTDRDLKSPVTNGTSASPTTDRDSSAGDASDPNSFVPPVGSFVKRVSRMHHDAQPLNGTPSPPTKKSIRTLRRALPKASDSTRSSTESGSNNGAASTNPYAFIPPSGSFNLRKPRQHLSSRDTAGAAAAAKEPDTSRLSQSMSNLNCSLSSLGYNDVPQNFHESFNSNSQPKRSAGAPPRHNKLKPTTDIPPAPSSFHERRHPPTVTITERRDLLSKTDSTRSWQGDSDLQDPMSIGNPLWSSLSQLDTSGVSSPKNTGY